MPTLKPWYKVVTPREDLREGRPLDASEFAVHLDHIRDGDAHPDYQDPVRFFERTFLTRNLRAVSGEVLRRLNGIHTESSALYNMTTQFGGLKITVNVESSPEGGLGERQTDDIRAALRGLGLNDNVE